MRVPPSGLFLAVLAKRDLPIFFNSDGGLVRLDNRVLTRLLRLELASAQPR
jgi:hypothetical protein